MPPYLTCPKCKGKTKIVMADGAQVVCKNCTGKGFIPSRYAPLDADDVSDDTGDEPIFYPPRKSDREY